MEPSPTPRPTILHGRIVLVAKREGDRSLAPPLALCAFLNPRQDFEVALALYCPLFIARLVLGANQTMRTTAAKRREIEVAPTIADTMLQMRALGLCSTVS